MRDQCDKIMKAIQFSAKSNEYQVAFSITRSLVNISKSTPSDIAFLGRFFPNVGGWGG